MNAAVLNVGDACVLQDVYIESLSTNIDHDTDWTVKLRTGLL